MLRGGAGDDILTAAVAVGTQGRSLLYGERGNDWLRALAGSDNRVDGGSGRDRLVAGDADAELAGGSGADTFVFYLNRDYSVQAVTDFEGDPDRVRVIGLSDVGAPGLLDDLAERVQLSDDGFDVTMSFDGGTELIFAGLTR
jgi:serralysin